MMMMMMMMMMMIALLAQAPLASAVFVPTSDLMLRIALS
jgi:hypothetical protein